MVFQLSEEGRKVLYSDWRKMGGCGIPNSSMAPVRLGAQAHWPETLTLGQIEDACPYTGRSFAAFFLEHLNRKEMVVPYENARLS